MPITFNQALGIHPESLSLHARRAEVLAANMANADTPNYKARDIDFKALLAGAQNDDPQLAMRRTASLHIAGTIIDPPPGLKYRIPSQPSVDGNTVDADRERTEFASNALGYEASLTFLSGRFSSLLTAIKGE